MKKYDMSKTEDFIHEYMRMCRSVTCGICELHCNDTCAMEDIDRFMSMDKILKVVEKWSEENPKNLMLTRREREFIEAFAGKRFERYIFRSENGAWISTGVQDILLNLPFESIDVGERVSIRELLTWEVSDE